MKAIRLDAKEQLRRTIQKTLEQQYEKTAATIAREKARQEIYTANEQFAEDIDACILYALHETCGFGRERLIRFFRRYSELKNEIIDRYQFADGNADWTWWCTRELEKIGVNVKDLRSEEALNE